MPSYLCNFACRWPGACSIDSSFRQGLIASANGQTQFEVAGAWCIIHVIRTVAQLQNGKNTVRVTGAEGRLDQLETGIFKSPVVWCLTWIYSTLQIPFFIGLPYRIRASFSAEVHTHTLPTSSLCWFIQYRFDPRQSSFSLRLPNLMSKSVILPTLNLFKKKNRFYRFNCDIPLQNLAFNLRLFSLSRSCCSRRTPSITPCTPSLQTAGR